MADTANHIFLPQVQPGTTATFPDGAKETLSATPAAVLTLPVQVFVNGTPVPQNVRVYGPGDVTAIDPQQIIRVEPPARTSDFEPNYFPCIEFDRPDFPWLFTPLKPDAQSRLRPWLCLVVVKKQAGIELRPATGGGLPVLHITSPASVASELPNLAESHLWAHAQVVGATKASLKSALEGDPAKNLSRLICPRHLEPMTDYLACVVPSFEVGRKAGLGQAVAADEKLAPAWTSGAQAPTDVTLPVYYFWDFRTGLSGDFEELVRRLQPRELPPAVGKRPIEIGNPGFPLQPAPPKTESTVLGLEGALRVVDQKPDAWSDAVRLPFQNGLKQILNTPWQLATKDGGTGDPCIAPPIYGAWQAATHEVTPGTNATSYPAPAWLNELNLDPRQRATAALGTQVINAQQEALMASAWEQLGEIVAINQRLRQAQLSRAVNVKYHVKTFSRLGTEAFLRVVAPARARIAVDAQAVATPIAQPPAGQGTKVMLGRVIESSFLPETAISTPLRKLSRPRGAINRQYTQANLTGIVATIGVLNTQPTPTPAQTRGAVTVDQVTDRFASLINAQGLIWIEAPPAHWERQRAGYPELVANYRASGLMRPFPPQPSTSTPEVYNACKLQVDALNALFQTVLFRDLRGLLNAASTRLAALASLNPALAVSQAVLGGLSQASPMSRSGDELEPLLDAPTFPQPMYEALRDLSQDYLFPGLELVPPETVKLLETNTAFIEAFMVGLNTEMSRELLWRGYPTDQRGTYFQQFWAPLAPSPNNLDIPPIHTWGSNALGGSAKGAGGKLVLLIRGALLQRYPGTIIYALRPNGADFSKPLEEAHPVFRGTLNPDVTFLGFDLTRSKLTTDGNWYFVLQQQPTEPRFGLDDDLFGPGEPGTIPVLQTWNDLNWAHLAPNAAALKALSYVNTSSVNLVPKTSGLATWGRNSAHMASITKQKPVRVLIRASRLIA